MVWNEFGFSDNPYSTHAIPPDAGGVNLLVGRDAEIKRIHNKLTISDRVITVEGDNGVGKTSLVGVAVFQAIDRYRRGELTELFLPVRDVFQLSPSSNVDSLRAKVYYAVARVLIENKLLLLEFGRAVTGLEALDRWLHDPEFVTRDRNLQIAGYGGGGGTTTSPNVTPGFIDYGFAAAVEAALAEAFPTGNGGLVCILDNLELLRTSADASRAMEDLRDSLFSIRGIRWVACGAQGVVRGTAASPRWNGHLAPPIEVRALDEAAVEPLIAARIEHFAQTASPYVPVEGAGFRYLYEVYNNNLREALGACLDYTEKLLDMDDAPEGESAKLEALSAELLNEANSYFDAVTGVAKTAWRMFDRLAAGGGKMSPGDHDRFGYSSYQALNAQTTKLVGASLVKAVAPAQHEDQRRKNFEVTPVGWLVYLARQSKGLVLAEPVEI